MMNATILAVDDEPFNLDILKEYLEEEGHTVITATNGQEALNALQSHRKVDLIILDRMMPIMNGMEVIERVKADPIFKDIPIIMQTAASNNEQILQGIKAGVYYYLTKPYQRDILMGIVHAVLKEIDGRRERHLEFNKNFSAGRLMQSGQFHFRTLEDARNLAYFIASCFPNPENTAYGISELLINAIEHGNLGITYAEKTRLLLNNTWQPEIEQRLKHPDYKNLFGTLSFNIQNKEIVLNIKDQGKGFDWEKYLEIDPSRINDIHGRGIAGAKALSFTSLTYKGLGNEVECRVKLPE
ncbi:MAG: response regulator [Holosporales bacterium]|jgi:CheY-like chemotaxis protein